MKNRQHLTSQYYVNFMSRLLFLASVVICVMTTYYVSGHILDSDTSSELILSKQLAETGKLLSNDWLYGSELRLFHVQLIYMPLMLILDDWQMVRFIGALIMQTLYIGSFACLVHAAGKSKNFFFFGASLLLLPASVTYGRIVLYHNHYLPNITIAFFLLALSMYFVGEVDWRSRKTWIHLALLAALSAAGGMNSIRQLMITHAPLLLLAFVLCWNEDAKNKDHSTTAFLKPANLNFLLCSIYSAGFSLVGLKAQGLLCEHLGIRIAIQSENNRLSFIGFNYIKDILYGFFHQFGYRKDVAMLSISGILALGGIFIGCYLLAISVNRILQSNDSQDKRTTLLSMFFLSHVTVLMLIFLITRGSEPEYYYPLYLALCFPWAVPLLLINIEELPAAMHPLRARKLFAIVSVAVLLLSSCVNVLFFRGSDQFPQTYEGLGFQNRDKKSELTEAVDFLVSQGYDKGYAAHWECNIVTEMTNGRMPMVTVFCSMDASGQSGYLSYAAYLYSVWLRESPCEKPFLLLNEYDADIFLKSDSSAYCTEIYAGNHHVAYSIDDLDGFINSL